MLLPASAAWWFLPFVAPICIWVAWNDMAFMKIPNKAVMALVFVYLIVGPIALSVEVWLWNWLHLVVVLAVGFVMNMAGGLGAGDAKFAAAAAPFVMPQDGGAVLFLFAAITLAAFVTHRGAKHLSPVRKLVPHWASWTNKKFPLGLALGGTLLFYLALSAAGF
ncbi:prepilin peptidase [Oceaniglobus ichthyenteri]|uniref:prepilin peptidase n=1 Tax=Oceaniglobus ichthyenteri TaxID=2136177 RepID=UPI001F0CA876|nr:prepilin peptidase [Oceaniglobus ichthyenteri]